MTSQPYVKVWGEWQPCKSPDKVGTMEHLRYLSNELDHYLRLETKPIEEVAAEMLANTLHMLQQVKFESELSFETSMEGTKLKINIFGNPTPNDVNQLSYLGVISDEQAYNWFKSRG